MAGVGQSIGSKMMGEMSGIVKDVGKGLVETPKQMVDGGQQPADNGSQPGQAETAGDSQERNVGGGSQQSGQQKQQPYGWGASLSAQFGLQQAQAQQRLASVRNNLRDLDQEMARVRQQTQQEAQQKQQIEMQEKQQKQEIRRAREQENKRPGLLKRMLSMGKGERKPKGK